MTGFYYFFLGVPAYKFFLFINSVLRRRAVRSNLLRFKKTQKDFHCHRSRKSVTQKTSTKNATFGVTQSYAKQTKI